MNERTPSQGHRSAAHSADPPFLAAVENEPRPAQPEPFFELRFAELHITLQRPPYRLMGVLATSAGALSAWLSR
ncbi:hypothetical protein [Streptomyces sp. NBC_01462]|uniref:hypothetical protein n=1 Tax=Streptomyces sp. NBC_01462 TaxID=2903876 RepID=UPI002E3482D4|nr:hypothetical protein [Streptomyces sp. NBC_01462]